MLWNASTRFGMPGLIHHREHGLGCVMSPPLQHIAAFVYLYKCRSVCIWPFLGIHGVHYVFLKATLTLHISPDCDNQCTTVSGHHSQDRVIRWFWSILRDIRFMHLCLNRSGLDHWGLSPDGIDLFFFSQLASVRVRFIKRLLVALCYCWPYWLKSACDGSSNHLPFPKQFAKDCSVKHTVR